MYTSANDPRATQRSGQRSVSSKTGDASVHR